MLPIDGDADQCPYMLITLQMSHSGSESVPKGSVGEDSF